MYTMQTRLRERSRSSPRPFARAEARTRGSRQPRRKPRRDHLRLQSPARHRALLTPNRRSAMPPASKLLLNRKPIVIGEPTTVHAKWHGAMEAYFTKDTATAVKLLDSIFADDIVFKPPTYQKSRIGKAFAIKALEGASNAFDEFHYTREFVSNQHWALEFKCKVDGLDLHGVDLVTLDAAGEKIVEFAVVARPPNAVQKLLERQNAFMAGFLAGEKKNGKAAAKL